jgi:enoyl-CoA hydratase/carnithine racemase
MTSDVEITREAGVMVLRMARPEKKNALTGAMYDAMTEALAEAGRDDDIGAVVIAGAGGAFTAGNDIGDFLSFAANFADAPAFRFVRALAACEVPLVAAVEGMAVGIGTTMLLHCDLAYAAPDAIFRMPFVDLGLVPEAGATLIVPRRFGMAKASELLLLAEPFDADTAAELGLVNAVLPTSHVESKALEQAGRLARKPREALLATRRLMRGDRDELLARIDEEATLFGERLASPEARAAFEAFLARARRG